MMRETTLERSTINTCTSIQTSSHVNCYEKITNIAHEALESIKKLNNKGMMARVVLAGLIITTIALVGNPITGPLAVAFTVAALACKILLPMVVAKVLASATLGAFVFNLMASDCLDSHGNTQKNGSYLTHYTNNLKKAENKLDFSLAFAQSTCLIINRIFRSIPFSFTFRTIGTYALGKIMKKEDYTFSQAYKEVRGADRRTFIFVKAFLRKIKTNEFNVSTLSNSLFWDQMLGVDRSNESIFKSYEREPSFFTKNGFELPETNTRDSIISTNSLETIDLNK